MAGLRSIFLGLFIVLTFGTQVSATLATQPATTQPSTQPAHPKPSFEEFWDACTQSGCSIYPSDPKEWEARKEERTPPHFNACDPFTYNAIQKPSSLTGLPDFVAAVGAEKKNFFIPITQQPEKVLQKGDILVFFRNTDPNSKSLYEHVTKNRRHSAVVGEDDQGLFRLDSQDNMSGRNFQNGTYHILRLRKYPREIKTFAQLREWQADPEKAKILEEWKSRRSQRIHDVNRLVKLIRKE